MATVFLIYEDDHGAIGVATSFKAAKQFLLRHKWVTEHTCIWINDRLNEDGDHYFHLNEVYGDNWEEAFLNFNEDELGNTSFWTQERELYEEEN